MVFCLKEKKWVDKKILKIPLGINDLPDLQKQEIQNIDFENGHLLILGGVRSGKTTTLQTIVMQLCRLNSPKFIHFYFLDFTNSGLFHLNDLPHTVDYMNLDETIKITKFIKLIDNLVILRKKEQNFKNIFIVIDGYEFIKESKIHEIFNEFISKILKNGISLGIHIVLSVFNYSSLKYNLLNYFEHKIMLFTNDASDVSYVFSKNNIVLENIKGRALIKDDYVKVFQIYFPTNSLNFSENILKIRSECLQFKENYDGILPQKIKMLPDEVLFKNLIEKKYESGFIPVGLDVEEVNTCGFNIFVNNILLIFEHENKKNILLSNIINFLNIKSYNFLILDNQENNLIKFQNYQYFYEFEEIVNKTIDKYQQREKEYSEVLRNEGLKKAQKLNFKKEIIIIYELNDFLLEKLDLIIKSKGKYNIYFILGCNNSDLARNYKFFFLRNYNALSDYQMLDLEIKINNKNFKNNLLESELYLINSKIGTKLKVPRK